MMLLPLCALMMRSGAFSFEFRFPFPHAVGVGLGSLGAVLQEGLEFMLWFSPSHAIC